MQRRNSPGESHGEYFACSVIAALTDGPCSKAGSPTSTILVGVSGVIGSSGSHVPPNPILRFGSSVLRSPCKKRPNAAPVNVLGAFVGRAPNNVAAAPISIAVLVDIFGFSPDCMTVLGNKPD